ncbi:MAG: TRAP transporter large permease [Thermodesulfobacteriota bacterium]|jgi:tripartite ATP-independent transporter DctM subunit
MEWWMWFTLIIGLFLVLLAIGFPVFLSFMAINVVFIYIIWGGGTGLSQLVHSIFSSISTFVLLPIPLFILLGEILVFSGVFVKAIDVLDIWLGRIPGRLCVVGIGAATIFSCISGSSIACTAMLGSLLLPEMLRRGYHKSIAVGSCMAGSLDMIIPPSALAVVLASLADISVGKLLISGLLPGILMAGLYAAYIVVRCKLQPSMAPPHPAKRVPWSEKIILTIKYVVPFFVIILIVLGVILLGWATPTESAAVGTLLSFILVALYKKLNWGVTKKTVEGALQVSVMMFMILTGATAFGQILAYTGASQGLVKFILNFNLPPYAVLAVMMLILLFLGTLMEQVAIMMVTIPIFMPLVRAFGWDPVWFGLLYLVNMSVGMKSPPFGLCLFVMQGIVPREISTMDVYKSVTPFILLDCIAITIFILYPPIVTILPNLMTH